MTNWNVGDYAIADDGNIVKILYEDKFGFLSMVWLTGKWQNNGTFERPRRQLDHWFKKISAKKAKSIILVMNI